MLAGDRVIGLHGGGPWQSVTNCMFDERIAEVGGEKSVAIDFKIGRGAIRIRHRPISLPSHN